MCLVRTETSLVAIFFNSYVLYKVMFFNERKNISCRNLFNSYVLLKVMFFSDNKNITCSKLVNSCLY